MPATEALIKPAADLALTLLKPLAQQAWKWTEQTAERVKFELCFGALEESLQLSYRRHSYFTSLVFKNEQKKLDDYYLPLTLQKHPENTPVRIDRFPHELLEKYKRLLIVDTAGMGKSTISKYLFLSCVRENAAIPILIELRKLSKTKEIVDFIIESTANIAGEVQRELVISLINAGRFLFLLDGFDEIPDSEKTFVSDSISRFIANAPDNWYIMTSRDEAGLAAYPDFQRFTLKPLSKEEAYSLLRLYDQNGRCSESLIEKLEDGTNGNVHEFLTNPLLTSLLYKSFEFKRSIPIRKHIFYRQVFEALFETHDLMKEDFQRQKKSGLDIDQFDEFLRYFGFLTYKDGKTEYSKDELLAYIEKTKHLTGRKVVSQNVVHDLTHGVPLMVNDGNYYRWVHRSMQEYFAALWVCRDSKERQRELLIKMCSDSKHQNLIVLCADIDPIQFRKTIIKGLAKKYVDESNASYKELVSIIPAELLLERKKIVAGIIPFIVTSADSPLNPSAPFERAHAGLAMIANYCESLGYSRHHSAGWGGPFPFVGYIIVENPMITAPDFQKLIPFIKTRMSIEKCNPSSSNLPASDFLPIEDNPNNSANSLNNFAYVTCLLKMHRNWFIDIEMADKIFKEIDNEENESMGLGL